MEKAKRITVAELEKLDEYDSGSLGRAMPPCPRARNEGERQHETGRAVA